MIDNESIDNMDLTLRQRISHLYNTARDEHSDTSLVQKASLISTLGGLAFEWGTGNEALLGLVGGNVQEATHSPGIVGLASGGVSFAEQGLLGVMMATTIYNFPKITNAIRELRSASKVSESQKNKATGEFARVLLLGSAIELANDNTKHERSLRQNLHKAIGNAAIIGGFNVALLGSMSGSLHLAAEFGAKPEAELVVHTASNPLTYLGIFAVVSGFRTLKRRFGNKVRSDDNYINENDSQRKKS